MISSVPHFVDLLKVLATPDLVMARQMLETDERTGAAHRAKGREIVGQSESLNRGAPAAEGR